MSKRRGAFNPAEWVTTLDARAHIKTRDRSGAPSTRVLHFDLLSGRIKSAYRHTAPDGTEKWGLLEPSDWEEVKGAFDGIPYAWVRKHSSADGRWLFFVRRADLDRRYPTVTQPAAAPEEIDDAQPPRRRKPGPKIKKNWRLYVAAETYRIRETENRTPSAAELALRCEQKLDYQPDTSDIQKLLRMLLGD